MRSSVSLGQHLAAIVSFTMLGLVLGALGMWANERTTRAPEACRTSFHNAITLREGTCMPGQEIEVVPLRGGAGVIVCLCHGDLLGVVESTPVVVSP